MPELTVIYRQKGGLVFSDGEVEEGATNLWLHRNDSPSSSVVCISTGLVVDALRVMVNENKIPSDEILFQYNNEVITCDADGRLSPWPNGFNDKTLDLLMRLS